MTAGDKTKRILSDPRMTIVVIAIAIGARLLQLIYFYTIGFDISYQVIAMHNFSVGNGITVATVNPGDIASAIYTPLINWPPGYSLLLLPFYELFGQNYIAAGLTIDIIAALLLIFVSRRILFLLDIPLYLVNLFTLLVGFFIYRFYFIASTDSIGVSLFLLAVLYMLLLFKSKKRWLGKTILISLFLLLCGSLKYLFIPVLFVVPAFIIIRGIADRDTLIRKAGFVSLVLLAIVVGGLLLYQRSVSGTVGYISEQGRGFFPQHLLSAYPFFPTAFIRTDTISLVAGSSTEPAIYRIFQVLHIGLMLLIIGYAARAAWTKGIRHLPLPAVFLYLSLCVSLAITLLLAVLSLWVPEEEIVPGFFWTYIEESRYYGLATILVHFFVVLFYRHYRHAVAKSIRLLFLGLVLLLIPEMIRCAVFSVTRIKNLGREEYTWQYEDRFQRYAHTVIKDAIRLYGTDKVAATGSNYYMNNRVAVYSHVPLLNDKDIYAINDLPAIKAAAPTILVAMIHERDKPAYEGFLSRKEIALAGIFDGYYFYTVHVRP